MKNLIFCGRGLAALLLLALAPLVARAQVGAVGTGTTSPGQPLTVQAKGGGALQGGGAMPGFKTSAGLDKYNLSLSNGSLNLSESNVASGRLFVQDGGNVGIGTTDPGLKPEVAGNVKSTGASGNARRGGSTAPAQFLSCLALSS